jgi:DNA repair protein SbcC/Rad50
MRPVHLHVEGFGVFRAAVELSFDDVDYFALVGPTGAGKSTIIDAMCFALYGSIPRYDDERLVGRVVSLGSQQAKVSLTFDLSADRYRATRVVRLQKGRTGGDALLERLAPDGSSEVLAENRKAMKGAVERLLGLSFAHFTKCIVLPQGEFAAFLHDEPAKRRDLLARLLDLDVYDRVGRLARDRAREAATAVEIEGRELEKLAFATDEARAAAEHSVQELTLVYKAIDEAQVDDDEDAVAIAELDARIRATAAHERLLRTITIPDGLDETAAEIERAHAALRAATEAHVDATSMVVEAETALESIPDSSELVRARDAHQALAALVLRLDDAEAAVARAHDELARTEKVVAGAHELVAEHRLALEAAQDAHRAHGLRAHLVAGQACPVCEQEVGVVPKRRKPAALAKSEDAVAEAQGLLDAARAAQHDAATTRASALATGAQLREQHETLQLAIVAYPDSSAVAAAIEQAEAIHAALAAARSAERAAATAESGCRTAVQAAGETEARLRRDLDVQREALLRAALDPPASGTDVGADWENLFTWGQRVQAEIEMGTTEIQRALDELRGRRDVRAAHLADSARAAGVIVPDPTLRTLREAVFEHGTEARHQLVRIDEAREHAAKLREQLEAARADHDVAQMLGELLRSNRFEKWMLAEALDVLVRAASTTLFALSQGRFSLASDADEEFVVVDHANADETRSVRTLSGGETFQASLALALALSDQLASLSSSGGSKLDSILLDEGFGSLDADTLDAVATTIEALGTEGRMVGLVTHVPALAERVPVRFRVASGAVTREDS